MEETKYNGTLDRLRTSKNNRQKYETFKEINYKLPSSISLLSNIIKNQNIYLLEWIALKKKLNHTEKEELLNKFIKVNYYCPDIVSHKKFNSTYKK